MEKTLAVAKTLNVLYFEKHNRVMDQMKMHKMMYLSQRESLIAYDAPLFESEFEAWKYGPVLPEVRAEYQSGNLFNGDYGKVSEETKSLLKNVFDRYDNYSAWDLSTLSHMEYSWQQARKGLDPNENSNEKLSLSSLKVDAKREFLRRQGVVLS